MWHRENFIGMSFHFLDVTRGLLLMRKLWRIAHKLSIAQKGFMSSFWMIRQLTHRWNPQHVGLLETYRYKRTGQFFIWNYIGNWYVFSKYLDNYCRYQYCANDTPFRNISSILRSIFQDILPKKDVAFCETTDTAHSYIKQIVNFSEINVSIDA